MHRKLKLILVALGLCVIGVVVIRYAWTKRLHAWDSTTAGRTIARLRELQDASARELEEDEVQDLVVGFLGQPIGRAQAAYSILMQHSDEEKVFKALVENSGSCQDGLSDRDLEARFILMKLGEGNEQMLDGLDCVRSNGDLSRFLDFLNSVDDGHLDGGLRVGLEDLLQYEDPYVRAKSLTILAGYPDGSALSQRAISAAQDPDFEIRRLTASALGKLLSSGCEDPQSTEQATSSLLALLEDSEPAVRRAAWTAAERCADEADIWPRLLAAAFREPDDYVRNSAAEILARHYLREPWAWVFLVVLLAALALLLSRIWKAAVGGRLKRSSKTDKRSGG